MMSPMYHAAKLEKLKQLKKLMYEFLGQDGMDESKPHDASMEIMEGEPMEAKKMGLTGAMESAQKEHDESLDGVKSVDESAGDPESALSELEQMKMDYFKPKKKAPRPGTAMFIAAEKKVSKPNPFAAASHHGKKAKLK